MANVANLGLMSMMDLDILHPNDPATAVDSGLLISAIDMDVATHNAEIDAILGLFAEDTTEFQMEVRQSGATRNQPIDEYGRSLPTKPVPPYTIQLPCQGSGAKTMETWLASQMMTVEDVAHRLSDMFLGDSAWVRQHIFGALFNNADWSSTDEFGHGTLTIKPLANADSIKYFKSGTDTLATDSHYLFQAAAIDDSNNIYDTIRAELDEHPTNTGAYVAFISSSLQTTTEALTDFYKSPSMTDPDIQVGPNETRLISSLGITLPRNWVPLGKVDEASWVVKVPSLPAGYIIAISTDGPRPLKRRLPPIAGIRGFQAKARRQDWPYFDEQWLRYEGYGVYNRVGAVVAQVGAGAYSIPTGYTMPMP